MKIRIFVASVILLLDVFLVPSILKFPLMLVEHGPSTPTVWFDEFHSIEALKLVFQDTKFRTLYLVSQGFIFCLILVVFWRDIPSRKKKLKDIGGPEAAGSGQHGTSRWQTEKETDQTTTVWKTNETLNIGGVVLGMEQQNKCHKVWLDTEDTHTLVIGTTRSGKTRTMIFPTIWTLAHAGESMVLSDPKGELYARTSEFLKKQGYKVILLDFRNPRRGNKWNPMNQIVKAIEEGDQSLAAELAWDIANMISPHSGKGERIWTDGQQSVLAALILGVAMEADSKEQKHLTSVYHTLIEYGKTVITEDGMQIIPLNLFFESLPQGHIAKSAFGTAQLAPSRTRGSFFTGVSSELKLFADPSISYLTSQQDHIIENIGKEKTAVFLVIPDEKSTRHILASLYISQCYTSLVQVATENNDRLPVRTHFLLDEFGNLPAISEFDKKITVSAGRGIRYTLIVQDFQQLKKLYNENASTITGNCHTWLYLLTTDDVTAEKISKKTGKYTVETESYSSTVLDRGHSRGFSGGITGRPLLTADEVLRFPKNHSLVLRARQFPAYLTMPDLSQWQADQDFVSIKQSNEVQTIPLTDIWIPNLQNEEIEEIYEEIVATTEIERSDEEIEIDVEDLM